MTVSSAIFAWALTITVVIESRVCGNVLMGKIYRKGKPRTVKEWLLLIAAAVASTCVTVGSLTLVALALRQFDASIF